MQSMKRYVFWRGPDGRPHRADTNKFAPTALLRELGENAEVGNNGEIQYRGFSPHVHEAAISWLTVVIQPNGEELAEEDTSRIIHSAILKVLRAKGGRVALKSEDVLKEADRLAANHFRLPSLDFVLSTSLSVRKLPIAKIIINGCVIRPASGRSKHGNRLFAMDKLNHVAFLRSHVESSQYQWVSVKATGRCIHEASNSALNAINLVRGLWTLFATFGQMTMHLGVRRQIPLGIIHVGPIHLLRTSQEELKEDAFWYDPEFVEDQKLFAPIDGWERVDGGRQWALRKMRYLKYRLEVERLIIRYVQALDETNRDVAFINLWSILEKLTGTIGANYDETVRRAVRPYADRASKKEKLLALRLRRNLLIHAAKGKEDRDQIVYMIKSYLEPHLIALIRNDFDVTSLDEYADCLSLPLEEHTLRLKRNQFNRMLRFEKRLNKRKATS